MSADAGARPCSYISDLVEMCTRGRAGPRMRLMRQRDQVEEAPVVRRGIGGSIRDTSRCSGMS